MNKRKDYTGLRNNRLTAISISDKKDSSGKLLWNFRCDCGNMKQLRPQSVISGGTKSCGCLQKEALARNGRGSTHGMTNTRFYKVWVSMKKRCGVHKNYLNIKYCTRWESFDNFKEDMFDSYQEKLKNNKRISIDRINNKGNYSKENCRWATQKEQMNNNSRNRLIKYKGKTKTMTQWAEQYGLAIKTLQVRLNSGLSIQKCLTLPVRGKDERWYKLR